MKNQILQQSAINHRRLFRRTKWQILLRRFIGGWQSRKTVFERGSTLAIILGLTIGGYFLFHRLFGYFLGLDQLGKVLLDRIFYLGWNTLFFLLIISNIVTAFSTLYRSKEVKHLLTSPVSFRTLFHVKFIDNLFYSSWALALIGIPILSAYTNQLGVPWYFAIPVIIIGLVSFLILAGITAILVLMLILRVAHYTSLRMAFIGLAVIAVLGFGTYFFLLNPPAVVVQGPASFRTLNQYLLKLGTKPFPFAPTYWLRETITAVAQTNGIQLLLFGGLLVTTSLAGWQILLWIAERWWYPSWQVLTVSDHHKRRQYQKGNVRPLRWYWKPFTPQMRGLLMKDVLQFWRLPNQWVQFMLLFVFLLIYLANLFNIAFQLDLQNPFWRTLTFFINFGFSGFILASMISRFIFPLISLEGPGFWFLRSSPLEIKTLFRQKFWLSVGVFLLLAELIVIISNIVMEIQGPLMWLSTGTLVIMSVGLSSIAIGLGARFPEFNETNPMKIASTAGGFLTVVLSLLYVAIIIVLMAIPTYTYFQYLTGKAEFPLLAIIISGVVIVIINIVTIWYPVRIGERFLERYEV